MKTVTSAIASFVICAFLSTPAFSQEIQGAGSAPQHVMVTRPDTSGGQKVEGLGESFTASDGTSDYIVTCNWTVYQQCLFGTYINVKLYRGSTLLYNYTYPSTGFGYGWTTTYYDVVGPGKSYTYKLVRYTTDNLLCGDTWSPTNAGSTSALKTPTNLSVTNATNSDKTINMTWSKGSDITSYYKVYENGTQIATTTSTSYTVNTTPGKTSNWGVATYSSSYNQTSAIVQSSMSTSAFNRPENFFASEDTTVGYVRLGWTCASDYATHFQVFRDDLLLATIPVAQKQYLDYAAVPGTEYRYKITSYNSSSGLSSVPSDEQFGRAAFLNASDGSYDGKVYVHWTDFPANFENGLNLYRDGVLVDGVYSGQVEKNDELVIPGRVHKYVLEVIKDTKVLLTLSDYGFTPANGSVRGFVTTPTGGGGVKNVEMRAYAISGSLNKSVNFDGTDDYVSVPALKLNSNTVTLSAWILRNGSQTDQTGVVFSRAGNTVAGLLLTSGGELRYAWNNASSDWSSGLVVPDGIWTFVALAVEPDKATLYMNASSAVHAVAHTLEEFDGPLEIGRDSGPPSRSFKGMINEVCAWSQARTAEQIAQDQHQIHLGTETGLAGYWRLNQSGVAGDYVTNGNHHGVLYGSPVLAEETPPVWHNGLTLANGSYTISRINWAENDEFTVRPFKEGHGFKGSNFPQDSLVLPFTQNDHAYTAVNFIDTTSIEISGSVLLSTLPPYPLPGVKVLINGNPSGETTDSSGQFSTSVSEAGKYTLSMEYLNHAFAPHDTLLDVQDPITNLVFRDTTRKTLSGRVFGGCDNFLGSAQVRLQSLAPGYVDTTVLSDGSGMYSIHLPAQKYLAQLVHIANPDSDAIISYFSRDTIDIAEQDTVENFHYHSPPIVRISDLPDSGCGAYAVPIALQERTYAVRIDVVEKYGALECPVSEGTVSIQDQIAYQNPDSNMVLVGGRVYYPLIPGYPNLAGGGPHPYQKPMIVQTKVDKYTRFDTVWVFIRGHKPRSFQFSTVSPQLPLMILRDPPGDKSYSYLSTQMSAAVSIGFSVQMEAGVGVYGRLKVGGGADIPGVGSTGGWVGGQVEATAGYRSTLSGSQEIKITANQILKTSDSDKIIGNRGDVFMGAALNILYALTDILDYDSASCSVVRDTGVVWNGNGFRTTYLYTESHIRQSVIPGLQALADVLSSSPDQSKRDSAALVQNQIDVWQQVLDRNDELKQNAITLPAFPNNISFSGGTNLNESATITSTTSVSIAFNLFLDVQASAEAGFKAGDFNEVAGGVKTFVKLDVGVTAGTTFELQNTVGFELADDDADPPGDVFSVDILGDPTYCTPVFKLLGGSSSCPWEPGTQPREGVGLAMNTYVANSVPPELPAQFDLYLYNLTQTNETRTYKLSLVQGSNPDGASISVGGAVLGDDELQFALPPNLSDPQRATLRVARVPGSVYDYDNLKLHLYSLCDAQFDTAVAFSVHFVKPCSDVNMARPALNWIVNAASNRHLALVLNGYNAQDVNLQQLSCEYRLRGAIDWTTLFVYIRALLPADSILYDWDMSALPEGAYELRASTTCAAGVFSTRVHSGVYDRTPPAPFGNPQPADGSLDPGDDIKIVFTETINAATVDTTNVTVFDVTRGSNIPITVACSGAELVIAPKVSDDLVQGDSLEVSITGVEDPYGNAIEQTISWGFRVNLITSVKENPKPIPTDFVLDQCYPNPFNPSTTIRYGLPRRSEVQLMVYNTLGQRVGVLVQGEQEAGYYDIRFDASGLSSGVYFYRLHAGEYVRTLKLLLLR